MTEPSVTEPSWCDQVAPSDWAAMTRLHESAHVTASEALGIPVVDVWANPDPAVAHGGQYRNGAGDSQLQSVVYLIGAEGGARELRDRGYDETIAHSCILATGSVDREIVRDVVQQARAAGWSMDPDLAYDNALQLLDAPGFSDAAHTVAQAMADQGDQLTGADVRAAIGSFRLDGSLWIPTSTELTRADQERSLEQPAAVEEDLVLTPSAADDDFDIDM